MLFRPLRKKKKKKCETREGEKGVELCTREPRKHSTRPPNDKEEEMLRKRQLNISPFGQNTASLAIVRFSRAEHGSYFTPVKCLVKGHRLSLDFIKDDKQMLQYNGISPFEWISQHSSTGSTTMHLHIPMGGEGNMIGDVAIWH